MVTPAPSPPALRAGLRARLELDPPRLRYLAFNTARPPLDLSQLSFTAP